MKNEIWKFGEDHYKVYTESIRLLKKISKGAKSEDITSYRKNGKEIAWDIIVPSKGINKVKKIIREVSKKK